MLSFSTAKDSKHSVYKSLQKSYFESFGNVKLFGICWGKFWLKSAVELVELWPITTKTNGAKIQI